MYIKIFLNLKIKNKNEWVLLYKTYSKKEYKSYINFIKSLNNKIELGVVIFHNNKDTKKQTQPTPPIITPTL
ncbi:MAG: hypothetical protein WC554_13355 [Clostridia bacterium]